MSLPQHLLCNILQLAAACDHRQHVQPGLRELIRHGLVCREWRSAAEAAAIACCAEDTWQISCEASPSLFSSAAVQRWAPHVEAMELHLSKAVCRAPALGRFMQRASSLQDVTVWGMPAVAATEDSAVDLAFFDAALACNRSVKRLHAYNYVPSALPASLARLLVNPSSAFDDDQLPPRALELLLVRCQYLPGLRELELDLGEHGQAILPASSLSGLTLPTLRSLVLRADPAGISRLNLSWLAQRTQRNFKLELQLRTFRGAGPGLNQHIVRSAAAAMQRPDDCLDLMLGDCDLSEADKHILRDLRADLVVLWLPTQHIDWAPAACRLCLRFFAPADHPHQPAQLVFAALSPRTQQVQIDLQAAGYTLQVLGFVPVSDRPWQLCVTGASVVEGLPSPEDNSDLCHAVRGPWAAYHLRNQKAADMGHWRDKIHSL